MYKKIKLISEVKTQNNLGEFIPTETVNSVWGETKAITRNEWHSAAANGLNPELTVEMPIFNYNEELIVEVDNKRYSVYRTYQRKTDYIELYLERKVGTHDAN